MNGRYTSRNGSGKEEKIIGCIFSGLILWLFATLLLAPWAAPAMAQGSASAALFRSEELDQLVAPIALYPDSLLAQVLMASAADVDTEEDVVGLVARASTDARLTSRS